MGLFVADINIAQAHAWNQVVAVVVTVEIRLYTCLGQPVIPLVTCLKTNPGIAGVEVGRVVFVITFLGDRTYEVIVFLEFSRVVIKVDLDPSIESHVIFGPDIAQVLQTPQGLDLLGCQGRNLRDGLSRELGCRRGRLKLIDTILQGLHIFLHLHHLVLHDLHLQL